MVLIGTCEAVMAASGSCLTRAGGHAVLLPYISELLGILLRVYFGMVRYRVVLVIAKGTAHHSIKCNAVDNDEYAYSIPCPYATLVP